MNKEDWLDYFEAINGREPSAKEIAEALAIGEFQDDATTDVAFEESSSNDTVAEVVEEKEASSIGADPIAYPKEQMPLAHSNNIANSKQQVEQLKEKGKNYLSWFLEGLKHPVAESSNSQFIYGLITLFLAAVLLAAGLVNYINRIFTSIINMTVSGESLKLKEPETFSMIEDAIRTNFGFSKVIVVTLIIFLAYAILAVLPAFINKFTSKSQENVTELLGKYVAYTPLLAVVNFLILVVSFFTSDKLVVSSKYAYQIASSFETVASSPSEGLSSVSRLVKEVPAIHSIQTVCVYLTILSIISLAVLLVAFLKNIKVSIGTLNNFYVTLISFLVFILIIFFMDKSLLSNLLHGLDSLKDSLAKLF
ncbi:hypothetical protein [Streptococcus mutans]|uniref:hypothetical protein n=1 Tax=Streptococcus mutans TaxID=1309 RepID=UPI0004661B2E|nr:hypothetical protein [Streptococcus mutans]NLQ35618.1 hypothetical protein [Streptococcus mutans]